MSSGFNPFAGDIHIQFDVVGRSLSLTVWRSGLNQPPRPQLTTTVPTTLPAGRVGFGTNYRQVAIHGFDAVRFQPTLRYSSYQRDGARYLRFLQIPTGYTLQSSPSLPAPEWSDIPGSDSIEVPTSGSGLFFQLRGN